MQEQVASEAGASSVLNGQRRVAALLLAMEKGDAERLLALLDEAEIKQIVAAAAGLGSVDSAQLAAVVDQFEASLQKTVGVLGSIDQAERLIEGAVPKAMAERILSALRGVPPPVDFWGRIEDLDPGAVAEALVGEHPQVIACAFSQIDTEKAAAIAQQMDPGCRNDIFRRMLLSETAPIRPMRLLESHLAAILLSGGGSNGKTTTYKQIAGIMNRLERDDLAETLAELEETFPAEAKALRELIFRFEDIVRLTARDRATLFEGVPLETLILALRDAPAELAEAAVGGLSARAKNMVEMELSTPVKPAAKDVERARRFIADLAIELAQRGEIDASGETTEAA